MAWVFGAFVSSLEADVARADWETTDECSLTCSHWPCHTVRRTTVLRSAGWRLSVWLHSGIWSRNIWWIYLMYNFYTAYFSWLWACGDNAVLFGHTCKSFSLLFATVLELKPIYYKPVNICGMMLHVPSLPKQTLLSQISLVNLSWGHLSLTLLLILWAALFYSHTSETFISTVPSSSDRSSYE